MSKMTNSQEKGQSFQPISSGQLAELRKAILGLDNQDLQRLSNLVQDPELFSEEISQLLPFSIKKLYERGDIDLGSLRQLIEQVLTQSVKDNPRTMAGILFPIMMPAIRKAVSEDIKRMMDSLNTSLEHGFSPKRIGWRFQALFSGRKYSEIVLSHAYVFKVNQVFLIHKATGLLLHQVFDEELKQASDADMVSSMLSAIKDFVQDSFKRDGDEQLDTIAVGNFNIWIEQGPHAIIAAIVEGNAPGDLRITLKEALEAIHINFNYELERFQGDTEVFVAKDRFLQTCLQKEKKEVKKRPPVILLIILFVLLCAIGYWTYLIIDANSRFNSLVSKLESTNGVVITGTKKTDGIYHIKGLYDPLSDNLQRLVSESGFSEQSVNLNLERYISLEYDLILRRAYQILAPPATIDLSLRNDTLFAKGTADDGWLYQAHQKAIALPGIYHFDAFGVNKEIKGEVVKQEVLRRSILAIENYYFIFKYNQSRLDSLQRIDFGMLVREVKSVLDFRFDQDSVPTIEVISHTSYSGNPEANSAKAQQRADQFVDFMVDEGIPVETLVPVVVFIEDQKDNLPVRSVSFKVKYVNPASL
jgi:OOP family OmpA-OmpF porin